MKAVPVKGDACEPIPGSSPPRTPESPPTRAPSRPNDITSLDYLPELPFTTKANLRDRYPFGMFAVPLEQIVRVHASSGTTSKPTVVGYTRGDMEVWAEVMARTLIAGGVMAKNIVHNAYGYGLFTGGLGFFAVRLHTLSCWLKWLTQISTASTLNSRRSR